MSEIQVTIQNAPIAVTLPDSGPVQVSIASDVIRVTLPAGATGATGATGAGVPAGGSAGQVLEKIDGTDYNTQWATPTGGSGTDLTFSGSASPYSLNSSTGSDVTIAEGSGVTLSRSGNQLTIAASGGSSPVVISPAQITADQDDYSPTDWATATLVRLSGDSGLRAITSFSATGVSDGEVKKLVNVGTYPLYIPSDHPDGTSANRISGGQDYFLMPKRSLEMAYDATASRWIVADYSPPTPETCKALIYHLSAASNIASAWEHLAFISSGASSIGSVAGTPAAIFLQPGATVGNHNGMYFTRGLGGYGYFGETHAVSVAMITFPVLSTGTTSYTMVFSITETASSTSKDVNNSVGIRYSHSINSGNFQCFSRNNSGTESTADSGVTVAANTVYLLRAEVDKSLSEARFYINNAYVGRITSNLPTTTTLGTRVFIYRDAGSGSFSVGVSQMFGFALYP